MLKEFRKVKQETGPGMRRWFEDDVVDLELIVWHDSWGAVEGFQICYNLGAGEHALTWRPNGGVVHNAVDSGTAGPFSNETPILVADGAVPWSELHAFFAERSRSLEIELRDFVLTRIAPPATGETRSS